MDKVLNMRLPDNLLTEIKAYFGTNTSTEIRKILEEHCNNRKDFVIKFLTCDICNKVQSKELDLTEIWAFPYGPEKNTLMFRLVCNSCLDKITKLNWTKEQLSNELKKITEYIHEAWPLIDKEDCSEEKEKEFQTKFYHFRFLETKLLLIDPLEDTENKTPEQLQNEKISSFRFSALKLKPRSKYYETLISLNPLKYRMEEGRFIFKFEEEQFMDDMKNAQDIMGIKD